MIASLLLWAGLARAASPAELLLDPISTVHAACAPVLKAAEARLATEPGHVGALLQKGDCDYRVGRFEFAMEDFKPIFEGRSLPAAMVHGRAAGEEAMRQGFVQWSILLARMGRPDEARANIAQGRQRWGDGAAMARVTAVMLASKGQLAPAWKLVDGGLERWPDDPHAVEACAEVASIDPKGISRLCDEALAERTRRAGTYNRAVVALNTGRSPDCLGEVEAGLAVARGEDRQRWILLQHACAAQSGDLVRADAALSQLGGAGAIRPVAGLQHAELLRRAGRAEDCLRLLETLPPGDPQEQADAATLRVAMFTDSGRLDEALAAARAGAPSALSRARLATALYNKGRLDEARPVLEGACPQLQGKDAKTCYDLLERMSAPR